MLIREYMILKDELEVLLSKGAKEGKISKDSQSKMLRAMDDVAIDPECANCTFVDMRFYRFSKEVRTLSDTMNIELSNLEGYYLYDERLWLYTKKNTEDEATTLSSPLDWFEGKRIRIKGKLKRDIFVKYPEEIDTILRANKHLYFLAQYIPSTNSKPVKFDLEEISDFEKIIKISNKKSGTILYYGIWS